MSGTHNPDGVVAEQGIIYVEITDAPHNSGHACNNEQPAKDRYCEWTPHKESTMNSTRLFNLRLSLLSLGANGFSLRSEEHTSELQSREKLVCRLPLEKKKKRNDLDPRARPLPAPVSAYRARPSARAPNRGAPRRPRDPSRTSDDEERCTAPRPAHPPS